MLSVITINKGLHKFQLPFQILKYYQSLNPFDPFENIPKNKIGSHRVFKNYKAKTWQIRPSNLVINFI